MEAGDKGDDVKAKVSIDDAQKYKRAKSFESDNKTDT